MPEDAFIEEILKDLGPTWWIFDSEPGMDDVAAQAGDSLKAMVETLGIHPFQTRESQDRLFIARFEFPVYGASFQHPEAVFVTDKPVSGWIDFLAGVPVDDCEMLLAIGQYSSRPPASNPDQVMVTVLPGDGKVSAPVPQNFFQWPDKNKVLLNLTALPTKDFAQQLAKGLPGEPAPTKPHFWFRVNLSATAADGNPPKFPVPGEFLALGVRMMPDRPWGIPGQLSSPFMYAGHWMDTTFYTSGVVTEVIDSTAEQPYPTYKVRWRTTQKAPDGIVTAIPSDFATYKVGDRVTILKDVTTTKTSELWNDLDMTTFGDNWQIVPICFYGLETPASPAGG